MEAGAIHRPCLASEAETWSASVDSCGESVMLMLPEEETLLRGRGEPPSGDLQSTISARGQCGPWPVRGS
ncbi:hypothetical protein COCON_G00211650 [Conger conger]|uniref:Uncharacterized protein n=1 Tax=Conger conger TaxID=82655 RepID=A0A9Q1D177_CONCO|nr:hypothetical protein COCON_G00211650 [Conger conger]